MRCFKRNALYAKQHPNDMTESKQVSRDEAIKALREYNAEFCSGKSDHDIVMAMVYGGVWTTHNYYWADPFLD